VARLDPLPVDKLSPEQKAIHDKIIGNRPKLGGPFSVFLRNPALADAANDVVDVLRANGKLSKNVYELITLIVARHWSAQYVWAVHEPIARSAGVSDAVIEAIRARRKPTFDKPDEALAYDAVTEILAGKVLSEPTYKRLIDTFGLDIAIELASTAGLYSMIAAVLNTFDIPTPNGERPFA
jgi:4-carboxymuconolactone decarboxylase